MIAGSILEYYCPTRIIQGLGSVGRLGPEVQALAGKRAVIVTDPGIVQAGLLDSIEESLESAGIRYVVYDGVGHDAQVGPVDEAAELCRAEKADVVIAVGGGSALAAGRAVGAIAPNGGSLGDHQGEAQFVEPSLPVVAIPTTAGSGSEVSAAVPYYDEIKQRKTGTRSFHFYPRIAILDGVLLKTLPYRQGALSGVDALTHAMEAYLTDRVTPVTDALALGAIRLLTQNLRRAISTSNLEAKQQALIGSTMANLACGNAKLGLAHLLNRPVNTLFPQVPYGESIGILLVPVMAFNLPVDIQRFADMAKAFGEPEHDQSLREQAESCIRTLKRFLADLNVTRCYPPEKVDRSKIPQMALMCAGGMHGGMKATDVPDTKLVKSFNRRRATIKDVIDLYDKAFAGWVL